MQAEFYLDLRVLPTGDDTDLQLEQVRNQIFTVLHGCFRQIPDTFALALVRSDSKAMQDIAEQRNQPKARRSFAVYDILRIFAAQKTSLQLLRQILQAHWKIRDYSQLGEVTPVPTSVSWKSFRRFRIPTLKAERNLSYNVDHQIKSLHERRLEQAKNLPYLRVKSQSTGQQFTVVIDIQQAENAGTGQPDGYGLARASQPFALPDF